MRLTLLAVTLLTLSGCATSPARERIELPFPLAKQTSDPIDHDWYRSFNDVILNTLVEEAVANSPTLEVAAARIAQAHAQATIVGADALPAASFGAGGQRQRAQFFAPGLGPTVNRFTSYSLALNVSWELDLWGRVRSGQTAAIADVEAATAARSGAQVSLIGQVTKAYFAALTRKSLLTIAELDLESARSLSERIEERYRDGLRPALDYRLSLSDLAATESRVAGARRDTELAQRQLEVLLARYPSGSIITSPDLPTLDELTSHSIGSELLWRRPDLVQAERRVAAAAALATQSRRALLPRIALTSSSGTVSDELSDLLDLDFSVWSLAANLAQPLFEGGRLLATIDLRDAQQMEAAAQFVETALRAFSEVETSLATAAPLLERELALGRALEESGASLTISEERYLRGVVDIVDLLQTRRSYFNLRSSHLAARLDSLTNRIDLHVALGGGFEASSEEGQP